MVISKIKQVINGKTYFLTKHDYIDAINVFHFPTYNACSLCYFSKEKRNCLCSYIDCQGCYFTFDPIDQLLEELKE